MQATLVLYWDWNYRGGMYQVTQLFNHRDQDCYAQSAPDGHKVWLLVGTTSHTPLTFLTALYEAGIAHNEIKSVSFEHTPQ